MAHPNVVLITVDHWPGRLLGCAGHSVILTPTLDQLAAAGTRYSRAYTECPVCIPARRTLMTGTTPRFHGDRTYRDTMPMPDVPTLAQVFRQAGYQASAVGKLHVYPQRSRIGFDDVLLNEEGRTQWGLVDDYELYLGERGFAGQQFASGLNNNDYLTRAWSLPEDCHPTTWTARQMARVIQRRDPTRPGFWYLSFTAPHPPLCPLPPDLELYRDAVMPPPIDGQWESQAPTGIESLRRDARRYSPAMVRTAIRAFYALCTHIDYQLRYVIGTLREEKLLDDTIILFTSDHGDMLGQHGFWGKRVFYEPSANVPMILLGARNDPRVIAGTTDERLVGLQDVMPTLLDLAGIPIPATVQGQSMVSGASRIHLYGEIDHPTARMLCRGQLKLIYYPEGNRIQLFNVVKDPEERCDLGPDPAFASPRAELLDLLRKELYGPDLAWFKDGQLVGLPAPAVHPSTSRHLSGQRGSHWPPPPRI